MHIRAGVIPHLREYLPGLPKDLGLIMAPPKNDVVTQSQVGEGRRVNSSKSYVMNSRPS